jgi:hypothetical protein
VEQLPAHAPAVHVEAAQALPGVWVPLTQVQGVFVEALHPVWVGAQFPVHVPPVHVWLEAVQLVCGVSTPPTHVHGVFVATSQPVWFAEQVPSQVPLAALQVELTHAVPAV